MAASVGPGGLRIDPLGTLSDTFTFECGDCTKTVRVVNGRRRRHWCRCPRRLRGRSGEAWADGYEWGRSDAVDLQRELHIAGACACRDRRLDPRCARAHELDQANAELDRAGSQPDRH